MGSSTPFVLIYSTWQHFKTSHQLGKTEGVFYFQEKNTIITVHNTNTKNQPDIVISIQNYFLKEIYLLWNITFLCVKTYNAMSLDHKHTGVIWDGSRFGQRPK